MLVITATHIHTGTHTQIWHPVQLGALMNEIELLIWPPCPFALLSKRKVGMAQKAEHNVFNLPR